MELYPHHWMICYKEGTYKMICYSLPISLNVGGIDYEIREDYRAALDILSAFNDDDLADSQKIQVAIEILYYPVVPPEEHLEEAFEKALWYLDCGIEPDDTPKPRTMDWEKDAPIIFPQVNKVAGFDVRKPVLIHWWTFYGWFMEIEDGLFSQVLAIRQKLSKGKKLEPWEREFLANNSKLCELKHTEKSVSDSTQDDFDYFSKLFN